MEIDRKGNDGRHVGFVLHNGIIDSLQGKFLESVPFSSPDKKHHGWLNLLHIERWWHDREDKEERRTDYCVKSSAQKVDSRLVFLSQEERYMPKTLIMTRNIAYIKWLFSTSANLDDILRGLRTTHFSCSANTFFTIKQVSLTMTISIPNIDSHFLEVDMTCRLVLIPGFFNWRQQAVLFCTCNVCNSWTSWKWEMMMEFSPCMILSLCSRSTRTGRHRRSPASHGLAAPWCSQYLCASWKSLQLVGESSDEHREPSPAHMAGGWNSSVWEFQLLQRYVSYLWLEIARRFVGKWCEPTNTRC